MSERWKVGDVIEGRYEIAAVKTGGMGIVFICYDREKKRAVAVKTYLDKYLTDNASVERFTAEAATWIKLGKHRNIVQAYYVPFWMFRPYIIMEYVAGHEIHGSDLAAWMKKRKPPLITVLDIAIQFCSGMMHAEKTFASAPTKFVHRDIKPSNILINSTAVVKITDFGISRSFSEKDLSVGWGTPAYKSPEQLADPQHVDIRSDIFSFGRVLAEMAALLDGKDCPKALRLCIRTCLEQKPADRFRTFSQLKGELLRIYHAAFGKQYQEPAADESEGERKEELLHKSLSFVNLGMHEEGIRCCNQALSLPGPAETDYRLLCFRGSSLDDLQQKEAALAEYAKAIALFPHDYIAYNLRANLFNNAGQLIEAIADYTKVIELNPEFETVYYNRGLCSRRRGQLDNALADFNHAIELGCAEAHTNRGSLYLEKQQYPEALADFKRAIELNPRDAVSYCNTALIYESEDRLDEALAYYNLSIKANPYHIHAYYNRGGLFFKKMLFEEAIEDFEKIFVIDPREGEQSSGGLLKYTERELNQIYHHSYRNCGLSYYCLEKWDKAKYYLKKYLDFPAIEKDDNHAVDSIMSTVLWLETKT